MSDEPKDDLFPTLESLEGCREPLLLAAAKDAAKRERRPEPRSYAGVWVGVFEGFWSKLTAPSKTAELPLVRNTTREDERRRRRLEKERARNR